MKRRSSIPLLSVQAAMALAGWLVIGAPTLLAQQQQPPQLGGGQQVAQPAPAPAAAQQAPKGPLDERVLRLEQRILDLQTVIGTLQTFISEGGGVPAQAGFPPTGGELGNGGGVVPGGGPSELSIRVLALDTQIKALTTQMEQIVSRLDQTQGAAMAPGQGAFPSPGSGQPQAQNQPFGAPPAGDPLGLSQPQERLGSLPGRIPQQGVPQQGVPQQGVPGFNTSTVAPLSQNPFSDPGPALQPQAPQVRAGVQPPPQPLPPSAAPNAGIPGAGIPGAGGGARDIYDASYQSFLRNDFQRAGNGFQSFVKTFPDDELLSNAYYWLGRTHYARRQYEPAAKAFLAGYKRDKKNPIAPDALLHLGMSLGAMGEKEAACSTFGAISKQFPNAPSSLKQDVGEQLKRAACKG